MQGFNHRDAALNSSNLGGSYNTYIQFIPHDLIVMGFTEMIRFWSKDRFGVGGNKQ